MFNNKPVTSALSLPGFLPPAPAAKARPTVVPFEAPKPAARLAADERLAAAAQPFAWEGDTQEALDDAFRQVDLAAIGDSLDEAIAEQLYAHDADVFMAKDADGNGYLDASEYTGDFQRADTNADGKLTLDEYMAHMGRYREDKQGFKAGDADGSGYLSSDEVADQDAFQQMDANADGKVDWKEYRRAQNARRDAEQAQPTESEAAPAAETDAPAEPEAEAVGTYTTASDHTADELAAQLGFGSTDALYAANPGLEAQHPDGVIPAGTPISAPASNQAVQDAMARRDAENGGGRYQPPTAPADGASGATATDSPAATGDTAQLLGAMTAEEIEQVLVDRGSVLAGQGFGTYILAMERQYGVPAAQFLAQAVMESSLGNDGYTQPGFNIGNIRPGTTWDGPTVDGGSGEFRVYGSWEEGIEDYFKLLAGPIYAGRSLHDQLYTYCPPSDGNDTAHYEDQIVQLIYQWTGIQM